MEPSSNSCTLLQRTFRSPMFDCMVYSELTHLGLAYWLELGDLGELEFLTNSLPILFLIIRKKPLLLQIFSTPK